MQRSLHRSNLRGRIALVTGGSQGIGAAIVRALANVGAQVIVTDLVDTSELADEVGGLSYQLDVTSEKDWVDVMEFAKSETKGLDILVNNAGVFELRSLADTTLEGWRKMHSVNVEGVFLGCKHALPLLVDRADRWEGGSSIVNVSSVGAMVGAANTANYSASKGAIRTLTKSLAIELAPSRIRVNSVHPGLTETAIADQAISAFAEVSGIDKEEGRRQIAAWNPMGRTAKPENVADGVVFLASDQAAFMTGAELVIDGGMTAQ